MSKPPNTDVTIKKMTEYASKTFIRMSEGLVEESRRMVPSWFDDRLSGKVPPAYTEQSISVYTVCWSLLMFCRRPI